MEAVDTTGRPFSLPSPTSPSLATAAREDNGINNDSNSNTTSPTIPKKRPSKSHVPAACVNCQKAHLACDVARPCKRCVQSGREDTCFDVQHKKRGRPRRRDRQQNGSGISSSSLDEPIFPSSSVSPLSSSSAMIPTPSSATVVSAATSDGILAPGLVRSSFSMTRPPGDQGGDKESRQKTMVTLFLSMDVCCARVSDEALDLLGMYPHEFAHRSLYDFILPHHADRLARIHRCLLDNANRQEKRMLPPTQRTTSECFSSTSPSLLTNIANGSLTLKEPLGFKTSSGSHIELQSRFYLGGGLGSDLFVPSSLERLYIVCLATADQVPSQQQQQHVVPTAPTPAPLPPVVAPIQQQQHHHHHHHQHPVMITSPPSIPSASTSTIAYHPDTLFNPITAASPTTTTTATTTTTTSTATSSGPITSLLEHTSISPAVAALFGTSEPVSTTTTASRTTPTAATVSSNSSSRDIDYMLTHTTSSPIYSPASPSCAMLNDREIDTIAMQQQPVSSPPSNHHLHHHHHHRSHPHKSSSYSPSYSPPRVLNNDTTTTTPIASPSPSSSLQEDDAAPRNPRPVGTPRVKLPRPEDCLLAAAATEEDDRQRRRDSKDHIAWHHPREMYLRETTSSRLLSAQANSVMGSWFPYQSPSSAMMNAVKNTTPHPSSTSSSLNPVATHHRIPSIHSRIPPLRPFVQRR